MASFCITLFDSIENPSANDSCFVAATRNLTLSKGSAYSIIYEVSKDGLPADLTGYSLRGTIKPSSSSETILLTMNTANFLLSINTSNSTIAMNLKESFTRRVTVNNAVYDIELVDGVGDASKIITGLISFI